MINDADRKRFLQEDLYNALRYLFEGAIAWDAWKRTEEKAAKGEPHPAVFRHQGVLGMCTTFMEARALYEFFHKHARRRIDSDDARADDFASTWRADESEVYKDYMAHLKPANKRMFHLVYRRSAQSGETATKGPLKEQVLNFAKDLRDLTKEFIKHTDDTVSCELARAALHNALNEAQKAADHYRITNPLVV
jgi:hypothetical protein